MPEKLKTIGLPPLLHRDLARRAHPSKLGPALRAALQVVIDGPPLDVSTFIEMRKAIGPQHAVAKRLGMTQAAFSKIESSETLRLANARAIHSLAIDHAMEGSPEVVHGNKK